jgi:hypothetical protein
MRGIQRICNLNPKCQKNVRLERPSTDPVFQRHTVQKLHCDKRLTILLADVINRADVGMI